MEGSRVTIFGKMIRIIMTMRSQMRKGRAAVIISIILVPSGATPFMTKRRMPNGGVDMAIKTSAE